MNQPMSHSQRNQLLARIAKDALEESRRRGIDEAALERYDAGVWGATTMKKLRRKQRLVHVGAADGGGA